MLVMTAAGEVPLFADRPLGNYWRAPIDNDGLKVGWTAGFGHLGRWQAWGLGPELVTEVQHSNGTEPVDEGPALYEAVEHVQLAAPFGIEGLGPDDAPPPIVRTSQWQAMVDGQVHVRERFDVPEWCADLPRLGVEWQLAPGWKLQSYIGDGPHECYSDRRSSARYREWPWRAEDEVLPYVMPQEFGHRTGVTRIVLVHESGATVTVAADGAPFEFSCNRYTEAQLTEAVRANRLVELPAPVLRLDAFHRGLGTASCGPDALERYRGQPGMVELAFTLVVRA